MVKGKCIRTQRVGAGGGSGTGHRPLFPARHCHDFYLTFLFMFQDLFKIDRAEYNGTCPALFKNFTWIILGMKQLRASRPLS